VKLILFHMKSRTEYYSVVLSLQRLCTSDSTQVTEAGRHIRQWL